MKESTRHHIKLIAWMLFFIIPLFIIMLSIPSYAGDYQKLGYDDNSFLTGAGNFNQNANVTTHSKLISTKIWYPLVADLNNDSTQEIISFDLAGNLNIKLYHDSSLTLVSSYTDSNMTSAYNIGKGMPIVYDIDGDGFLDIIISYISSGGSTIAIDILGYNGTALSMKNSFINPLGSSNGGEVAIGCSGVNRCAALYSNTDQINTFAAEVRAQFFNSTAFQSNARTLVSYSGGTWRGFCLPKVKYLAIADADADGYDNVGLEVISMAVAGNLKAYYVEAEFNSSNQLEKVHGFEAQDLSSLAWTNNSAFCGQANLGRYITSSQFADLDANNQYEIMTAYMTDADSFQMESFTRSGVSEAIYPSIASSDGTILSNIVEMDAEPSETLPQYCVMGWKSTTSKMTLLCSYSTNGANNRLFDITLTGVSNVTDQNFDYTMASHGSQMSDDDTLSGEDLDEVVSTYGVFALDTSIVDDALVQIYTIPVTNGVIIPADAQNTGANDLLALTSSSLYYLDDGIDNHNIEDINVTYDPCITDQIVELNTTIFMLVRAVDNEANQWQSRAYLYYGDSNQQELGYSTFVESGQAISFEFIANKTITSGVIRIEARDSYHPDPYVYTKRFTVGSSGVSRGDCFESETTATTTEIGSNNNDLQADNIVTTSLNDLDDLFNLGLGSSLIWLIIMVIVALTIWFTGHENAILSFGIIGIVEVLMLIIGVKLAFISTGILLTIIIVCLIPVAFWIRSLFSGQGG